MNSGRRKSLRALTAFSLPCSSALHIEADAAGALVAARVRGHNDHGIFKIDRAALRVGDASVVEDLEQDVQHIRVRLFDLVEKHDAVGLAADLLGELSGLVIPDVARRGTDDARNAVLFHKLGHIEPDERFGGVEEIGGEPLYELRLADAGGADKNEAHGLALGLQSGAAAAGWRRKRRSTASSWPMMCCLEPSGKTGETLKLVVRGCLMAGIFVQSSMMCARLSAVSWPACPWLRSEKAHP